MTTEKAVDTQKAKVRGPGVQSRRMQSVCIQLTEEQQHAIRNFWEVTGSVGTAEILIEVVGDKISPASIQVGTAK